MIKKMFGSSNPEDLLAKLLLPIFDEDGVNKLLKTGIDINWKNKSNEGFLHLCAKKNLTQSLTWLVDNGANLESEGKDGCTPLFYAVHAKATDAVKILIEHSANVDHVNIHNRTALQEAVISDTRSIVEVLMEKSHSLNNIDEHGHNLIFDAVANGNKDLITKVAHNKDININLIDKKGDTVLHQNGALKNSEIAIELMESGADPTVKDSKGKNFLFYAAAKGIENEGIIEKAINLGCDINSRNDDNQTILMETLLAFKEITPAEKSRRESLLHMVRKLISSGVELDSVDNENETALFIAVRNKDMDSMLILLEEDEIDINHQNNQGDSVLNIAAYDGIENLDLILILLDFGANPNLKDGNGKNLIEKLVEAVLYTHHNKNIDESNKTFVENAQYMVVLKEIIQSANVNLESLTSQGKPIFFDAVLFKNENLFKLLNSFNININQKDKEGRNIIHNLMDFAKDNTIFNKKTFLETLKMLISMGADVNSKDEAGNTTVHNAILNQNEQIVKTLLDLKADIKAVDNKGRNLIHNCIWDGKLKHFRLLHSYNETLLNKVDKFGILPINYAAFMGHKDLVIEMLRVGSHINNTNKKNSNMIKHLLKFSNNIASLTEDIEDLLDKKNMSLLLENMVDEFSLDIDKNVLLKLKKDIEISEDKDTTSE